MKTKIMSIVLSVGVALALEVVSGELTLSGLCTDLAYSYDFSSEELAVERSGAARYQAQAQERQYSNEQLARAQEFEQQQLLQAHDRAQWQSGENSRLSQSLHQSPAFDPRSFSQPAPGSPWNYTDPQGHTSVCRSGATGVSCN